MVQICSSMDSPGTASGYPINPRYSMTSEFHTDSNGAPTTCPTSPAMSCPSTIHRHPLSPHNALSQNPYCIEATPTLTARGPSTTPYPINFLQSPQQLLEQREARWNERIQTRITELEHNFSLKSQKHQEECHRHCDEWYKRCENQAREIQEKSDENATLIAEVLHGKIEKIKLMENFNIRGALEHMVYHAKLIKEIRADCPAGIQEGLNELAKTPEFTRVLGEEVASRGLTLEAVIRCIALIYNKTFLHAHGNDDIITLYNGDYTANEVAVLATFLKVQSARLYGLEWKEEKRKGHIRR
ncbi:hypothetical protein B9Z19DRAFT_1069682 [Tuber borchii]|uniref:Uncharacterized protein n=1 Tax=Tuber borchii TaxID=42251 RepID=A0A2T6ZAS6_TUBBO|nr:hypothetical protein B9Z19DRAFT_1069682 [Tuber borchii]